MIHASIEFRRNMIANPILVAIELLQLHDLKANVQAAAEKHEARAEAIQDAAPTPRQLKPTPILINFGDK